jgi:putative endonuclease
MCRNDIFPKKKWYVYLVESSGDNILYCGVTNNLDKRIETHNNGKGSKVLRGSRLPVKLFKYWEFETKSEACKEEYRIKQLTRKEKLNL